MVTIGGAWYINTTDGGYVEMREGDVLFEDDHKGLTVNGTTPSHWSGSIGGPCNQLIISLNQTPAVIDPIHKCDWVSQLGFS